MGSADPTTYDLLRLTLVPGLGPVLIGRAIQTLGSAEAVLRASPSTLRNVHGIGPDRATKIHANLPASTDLANRELATAESLNVQIISIASPAYPPLLRQIPDPPPILYVRGSIDHAGLDRYTVAVVGPRSCSHYGHEQAARFAGFLAQAGICVVSGGARGIDTAAHQAALRNRGRTIAVLGCGLANIYPPDNEGLFRDIATQDGGAVISELPLATPPNAENFPARNRIISGLSLGVLVIEAGKRSGALITARLAVDDHGREVFALPGRVDSPTSEGALDLIKKGEAALVTAPADIIEHLESLARHHFSGTHQAVTADPSRETSSPFESLLGPRRSESKPVAPPPPGTASSEASNAGLTESQVAILEALAEPRSFDELANATGSDASRVRSDVTMLELRRRVKRVGSRVARV